MSRRPLVDPCFPGRLRELLAQRCLSYRAVAARTFYSKSYVHDLATGRKVPTVETARRLDDAIGAGGQLVALVYLPVVRDDEQDAAELARRVAATDVGEETLARLEVAVDTLAMAYATTAPQELLEQVRTRLGYVAQIVDARKTLQQQRRLLVVGGWLSLLAATAHIDLRQSGAAGASLTTAATMAGESGHREIEAWCLETRAWDVLTAGDYPQAVNLSQRAQAVAPRGSSAQIQSTAQEGRAWARMRRQAETRATLDRVARLTASLVAPEQPEHHYKYDPDKALSYTATTLAWAGDPAAEEYTRTVIQELQGDDPPRPRRIASARLDLALALVAARKPDEAAAAATVAVGSGRVVPSNWWRATEVLAQVERAGVREAADLREVYELHRPGR